MASSVNLSWKPEHLNLSADYYGMNVDQANQLRDVFCQKVLDKLNKQAAAIFIGGGTGTKIDWGNPANIGHGNNPGKALLVKLSEGPERTNTMMTLYHTYIVDLKNHAIYPYGPILAENKDLARDQALAYLVGAATVPDFEDVKVFDGEIGHYHIAVQEISNCIPNKIKEE